MTEEHRPLILHIIDELPPDGAERLLADLMQNRTHHFQYKVLCLINEGALKTEIESTGVDVTLLKRGSKWNFSYLINLSLYIRKLNPYAVHTHLFTADFWGRLAAYLAGVRRIFSTVHSTNDWMSRLHIQVDKLLATVSTKIIACSDKVSDQLINERTLPPSKVVLIPNGVAIERFKANPEIDLHDTFGLPTGKPTFALIGRLHEAKGHLFILPILEKLQSDGLEFNTLFIGEGDLEPLIQKKIQDYHLNNQVFLTGFRQDIPSILQAIDFLIMPSRWEGLPITLLESMAAHTPVIASTVGGIPSVLAKGSAGILVHPNDDQGWYDSIALLINDTSRRQELAKIAYTRVINHYSAASVQLKYERLYRGLAPSDKESA